MLLISRNEEKLAKLETEISTEHKVQVRHYSIDLEHFPSKEFTAEDFGKKVSKLTDNGLLVLLVCNAGMSDLARHFTDKSLERNMNIIKLNTIANIAMIQTLMPKLVLQTSKKSEKVRSGVITLGALTAIYPGPTFAISTGNKHFVRGFTLAARQEFKGKVDFMIAHPVAVQSNIVAKKEFYIIKPSTFARNTLKDFCKGRAESYGSFSQELSAMFNKHFLSTWQQGQSFLLGINHFSKLLDRPVDLDPIEEKLGKVIVV